MPAPVMPNRSHNQQSASEDGGASNNNVNNNPAAAAGTPSEAAQPVQVVEEDASLQFTLRANVHNSFINEPGHPS